LQGKAAAFQVFAAQLSRCAVLATTLLLPGTLGRVSIGTSSQRDRCRHPALLGQQQRAGWQLGKGKIHVFVAQSYRVKYYI